MKAKVKINDSGLKAKLKTLASDVQSQAFKAALLTGALVVENDAKTRVPYVTGTLRRSIHSGTPYTEGQAGLVVDIGTDIEYAARIEYGFSKKDKAGRSYHQSAQPYLRPALNSNQEKIVNEIEAALKDIFNGY